MPVNHLTLKANLSSKAQIRTSWHFLHRNPAIKKRSRQAVRQSWIFLNVFLKVFCFLFFTKDAFTFIVHYSFVYISIDALIFLKNIFFLIFVSFKLHFTSPVWLKLVTLYTRQIKGDILSFHLQIKHLWKRQKFWKKSYTVFFFFAYKRTTRRYNRGNMIFFFHIDHIGIHQSAVHINVKLLLISPEIHPPRNKIKTLVWHHVLHVTSSLLLHWP